MSGRGWSFKTVPCGTCETSQRIRSTRLELCRWCWAKIDDWMVPLRSYGWPYKRTPKWVTSLVVEPWRDPRPLSSRPVNEVARVNCPHGGVESWKINFSVDPGEQVCTQYSQVLASRRGIPSGDGEVQRKAMERHREMVHSMAPGPWYDSLPEVEQRARALGAQHGKCKRWPKDTHVSTNARAAFEHLVSEGGKAAELCELWDLRSEADLPVHHFRVPHSYRYSGC